MWGRDDRVSHYAAAPSPLLPLLPLSSLPSPPSFLCPSPPSFLFPLFPSVPPSSLSRRNSVTQRWPTRTAPGSATASCSLDWRTVQTRRKTSPVRNFRQRVKRDDLRGRDQQVAVGGLLFITSCQFLLSHHKGVVSITFCISGATKEEKGGVFKVTILRLSKC